MLRWMALFALFGFGASIEAQPFVKVYDKFWGGSLLDSFETCAVDSSGNAYAGGVAQINQTFRHNKVVKYNATGTVAWSQDLGISEGPDSGLRLLGTFLIGSVQTKNVGTRSIQSFRLNAETGAIEWTRTDSGFFESPPAVTSTRAAIARGVGTNFNDIRITCFGLTDGLQAWDVALGQSDDVAKLRETPGGDFVVMTSPFDSDETILQKLAGANGAVLWQRRFPKRLRGSFDVLKPSGNIVVGVDLPSRAEILDGATGSTLRVDPMPTGVVDVKVSVGNSYFAQCDDFSTRVQYRDGSGYLLGIANTIDEFSLGVVDSSGKLISALHRINPSGNTDITVLKVARVVPSIAEFFPINPEPNEDIGTFMSAVATGGVFIASAGSANFGTNTQARVVLFRQILQVNPDVFAYRRGTALDVGSPGFLANDAAWAVPGVLVGIQSGTSNGTVSLNANRSFRYVPNTGSQQTDSFTYVVKIGTTTRTQTVSLVPLLVSGLDVGSGTIIGGESRTGKVLMNQVNPFHNLVVQLSENIDGMVVTSSIQIPQGKSEGEFNIFSSPVATDQVGTISAKLDGLTTTVPFTVKRAVPLKLVVLPEIVVGGQGFTGTVKMRGVAPVAGYVVNITHSGTEITTPISVTVPAGADSVSFAGSTGARSTPVTHLITATSGGVSKTANLTLNPGGLFSFAITPTTVRGGISANGKVQTAGVAPTGGTVVTMTKDGGNVSVPPTVTVPAGAQFKNFTMTTSAVTATVTRTITATFGTIVKTQTLTITP